MCSPLQAVSLPCSIGRHNADVYGIPSSSLGDALPHFGEGLEDGCCLLNLLVIEEQDSDAPHLWLVSLVKTLCLPTCEGEFSKSAWLEEGKTYSLCNMNFKAVKAVSLWLLVKILKAMGCSESIWAWECGLSLTTRWRPCFQLSQQCDLYCRCTPSLCSKTSSRAFYCLSGSK